MDKLELNRIYNENCLDTMFRMPDGFVDLTVTSPPYDNLRSYKGNNELWNEGVWKSIIKELYRVTKNSGVVVWVVGDATIKGSETGTSFKQALWAIECGFNLHDTMIYQKGNPIPNKSRRYTPSFEYMFIWGKGNIATFNPILIQSKYAGKKASRTIISKNGDRRHQSLNGVYAMEKKIGNIFTYNIGSLAGKEVKHPAKFPEQLANDHIISWSNEGDLVYDPFMGSGTTAKMALINKRNFIGSELDAGYCDIANERIAGIST